MAKEAHKNEIYDKKEKCDKNEVWKALSVVCFFNYYLKITIINKWKN